MIFFLLFLKEQTKRCILCFSNLSMDTDAKSEAPPSTAVPVMSFAWIVEAIYVSNSIRGQHEQKQQRRGGCSFCTDNALCQSRFSRRFASVLAALPQNRHHLARQMSRNTGFSRPSLRCTSDFAFSNYFINCCCDQPKLRMNITSTVTCSNRTHGVPVPREDAPACGETNSLWDSPASNAKSIEVIGMSGANGLPTSLLMALQYDIASARP